MMDPSRYSVPLDGSDIDNLAPAMSPVQKVETVISVANQGMDPYFYWISRIERYGVTDSLVSALNKLITDIETVGYFLLDGPTDDLHVKLQPRRISTPQDPWQQSALVISELLANGWLKGLKRCALKDCRKYFVRGPKAKWCSDTCGSRIRNKEKRKRDRNNGAIV